MKGCRLCQANKRCSPGNGNHRLVNFLKTTRLKYKICNRFYISAPCPARAPENRPRQNTIKSFTYLDKADNNFFAWISVSPTPGTYASHHREGIHARLAVESVSIVERQSVECFCFFSLHSWINEYFILFFLFFVFFLFFRNKISTFMLF